MFGGITDLGVTGGTGEGEGEGEAFGLGDRDRGCRFNGAGTESCFAAGACG